MLRKNVQVYIVRSTDSKLLMLKRTKERSGYWQPVCGGIEMNELAHDTAIREVCEETGITNYDYIEKLPFEFKYQEPKNGIEMDMEDVCFLMTINSEYDVRLSNEHEQFKWINFDEVSELTNWEPIVTVCEYLNEKINN